jgi:lysophospholipase L1-like esterase
MAADRKRTWLFKLALALGVCVAMALGAELYLRFFAPVGYMRPERRGDGGGRTWTGMVHVASKVRGLSYEVAPNVDTEARGMRIRTNSFGMRRGEPLPDGTPHLVRIAAIGDSFTFGFAVNQGQDFPAQLELLLNQDEPGGARRFDVLNFGVGGYSTVDEDAVLREKALAFKPDLVVLGYCLNDPQVDPIEPLQVYFSEPAWWQYSELLRYIANKIHGREVKRYGGGNYYRYLHAPDGPCWPLVAGALDDIRDTCNARTIPVVLVILPMLTPKPWSEYGNTEIHQFVGEQARARGFHVLDLMDTMKAYNPATLCTAADDPHFTPLGNQIAARAIEQFIRPLLENAGK